MSIEDFFNNLDKKINENNKEEESLTFCKENRKEFLNETISRILTISEAYRDGLQQRGILTSVSHTPRTFIFCMKYKNGWQHDLALAESPKFDGYFNIIKHSTNDDGRRFTSTDGVSYSESNWDDNIFKVKLENHIDDYFFYSKRHG